MNIRPIQLPLTEHIHTRAAWAGIPLSGTFELTPSWRMSWATAASTPPESASCPQVKNTGAGSNGWGS